MAWGGVENRGRSGRFRWFEMAEETGGGWGEGRIVQVGAMIDRGTWGNDRWGRGRSTTSECAGDGVPRKRISRKGEIHAQETEVKCKDVYQC